MPIARILTVLDKPKHKQTALQRAKLLQPVSDATVELVSFGWNSLYEDTIAFDAKQRRQLRHDYMAKLKEWQSSVLRNHRLDNQHFQTKCVWAHHPEQWVADHVKEAAIDLVIKSKHNPSSPGHSGIDLDLIHTCPANLWFANTKRHKTSGNILATVDLKHQDARHRKLNQRVLQQAKLMAQQFGANLHVVYAVEPSQVLLDLDITNAANTERKAKNRYGKQLDTLLQQQQLTLKPGQRHWPVAKVGHAVSQVAKKINADLVVLGSHSKRTLRDFALGSGAEKILARARHDVLLVRP